MAVPIELPAEPVEPDVTREDAPERDDPEDAPPELDPLRGAADPLLPLDDDEGVRDPAWTRGGSGSRDGAGALAGAVDPPEAPPDEPEEPDEPEDPPAGRGIA